MFTYEIIPVKEERVVTLTGRNCQFCGEKQDVILMYGEHDSFTGARLLGAYADIVICKKCIDIASKALTKTISPV